MKQFIILLALMLLMVACRETNKEPTASIESIPKIDSLALSLGIDQKHLVEGRHIEMQGAVNFRDLGGYKTQDGKTIKWGNIYRSGKLSDLTDNDRSKMKSLGIKTVIDFRTNAEVAKEPDALDSSVTYFHFPIGEDKWAKEDFFKTMMSTPTDSMEAFMTKLYQDIPLKWSDSYKKFFEVLKDTSRAPLVFHCTAGKDRAGIGTALVLHTLGVDMKTAENDYVLSNYYRHEDNKKYVEMMTQNGIPAEVADKLLLISPAHFKGIFEAIAKKHKSLDHYSETILGIDNMDKEELRTHFLR